MSTANIDPLYLHFVIDHEGVDVQNVYSYHRGKRVGSKRSKAGG